MTVRFFSTILCAAGMLLLCACGGDGDAVHTGDDGGSAPVTTTAPQTSVTTGDDGCSTAAQPTAAEPAVPVTTAPGAQRIANRTQPFYYMGLVELLTLESSFIVDLKYATQDNFTGAVQYEMQLCLAQRDVADMLLKASAAAHDKGYCIKIFDLYRPVSVQQALHDAAPAHLTQYVPAPGPWAQHSRGVAVDCTLTDMDGVELDMPSPFDEFSEKAHVDYADATDEQKANRALLIDIMKQGGFTVNPLEWWHFYKPSYTSYPILDISFAEFLDARAAALDSDAR